METDLKAFWRFINCVGIPCNPKSLSEGFQAYIKKTSYAKGCFNVSCDFDNGFDEAILTAKEADFVIIVAGLDLSQETEDHDRVSLLLPGKQKALVSSVAAASKKPVILVLTGGGPLDVSFAEEDPRIASILWIGYPLTLVKLEEKHLQKSSLEIIILVGIRNFKFVLKEYVCTSRS